ncbi:patatin-like phospholipase family protein [Sphingomonas colocasiae]|uniref:Patatin-like phospholipase family protein n=1 Tax=Sphingomonas colocasiae TaxID=1848973 RepID=A0ABS7PVC7_9SPHN|nr:patatin-like phospholipase family protein [Sphingomonas colocasiae]
MRLASLLLFVAAGGCAKWPERPQVTAAAQAAAQVPGFGSIRHWADAPLSDWSEWRAAWLADRAAAGIRTRPALLAISSGSDKGAFGAGYLAGWTARGDRPEFAVVTGVSTGALIAPFAFLGPRHDATLRELYTSISARDIYRARLVSGLAGGPSFADSRPLERLIARHVTTQLLDRIAAEHRRGATAADRHHQSGRGPRRDMGSGRDRGQPVHRPAGACPPDPAGVGKHSRAVPAGVDRRRRWRAAFCRDACRRRDRRQRVRRAAGDRLGRCGRRGGARRRLAHHPL